MGNSDLIWANNEQSKCGYRAPYLNTSMAVIPADWLQKDILGTVEVTHSSTKSFLWSKINLNTYRPTWAGDHIHYETGKLCISCPIRKWYHFLIGLKVSFFHIIFFKEVTLLEQNWVIEVSLTFNLLNLLYSNCIWQLKPQAWILSVALCFFEIYKHQVCACGNLYRP